MLHILRRLACVTAYVGDIPLGTHPQYPTQIVETVVTGVPGLCPHGRTEFAEESLQAAIQLLNLFQT